MLAEKNVQEERAPVSQSLAIPVPGGNETQTSDRDSSPLPEHGHVRTEAGEGH